MNDVIEAITGIEQHETIPDAVVRAADQIELVDMSPEALRRRMAHGNIYPPEKVDTALANYFREGNLGALRELALMWVADRVDEALARYREMHGITSTWETRERVVVAITGAPGGEAVIRRAARMASRVKGELIGVHIRSGDGLTESGSPDSLAAQRHLLDELGARYHELASGDVAGALVRFAAQRERDADRARRDTAVPLDGDPPRLGHQLRDPGVGPHRRPRHLARGGSTPSRTPCAGVAAGRPRSRRAGRPRRGCSPSAVRSC